jgi:exopolysaccharide biosynthesis WecB/TagA/CpsF family protein
VNSEVFVLAHEIREFGRLLERTVNVIDSRVVQQFVRLRELNWRPPGMAGGADSIYPIAAHVRSTGEGMFLLGAAEEVNRRACSRLRTLYPGLRIGGFAPPMVGAAADASWSEEALSRIREFAPLFLGVCLGPPRQEFWMDGHRAALAAAGVRVAMALGGTADFVAGAKPRAPRLMNWLGLEWLFRLLWEPRRRWQRTAGMLRMPWYALFYHRTNAESKSPDDQPGFNAKGS